MENNEAIFKCRPDLSDFKITFDSDSHDTVIGSKLHHGHVSHCCTTATILEHETVLLIILVLWR